MSGRHLTQSEVADSVGVEEFANFNQAVHSHGSAPVRVMVGTDQTIASDTTIPDNVTVVVGPGATITVNHNVTLTVKGNIEAGSYQIFEWGGVSPDWDFSQSQRQERVLATWWGAKGDGVTNNQTALTAAFNCGAGKVILPDGVYATNEVIYITTSDTTIEGTGNSWLFRPTTWSSVWSGAIGILSIGNGSTTTSRVKVKNIKLDGNYYNLTGGNKYPFNGSDPVWGGLNVLSNCYDIDIEDCYAVRCSMTGFFMWGGNNGDTKRVTFLRCTTEDSALAMAEERGGAVGHNHEFHAIGCRGFDNTFGIQVGCRKFKVTNCHFEATDQYALSCGTSDWGDLESSGTFTNSTFVLKSTARNILGRVMGTPINPVVPLYVGKHTDMNIQFTGCTFICEADKQNFKVFQPVNCSFTNCEFIGGSHPFNIDINEYAEDYGRTPVPLVGCKFLAARDMHLNLEGPVYASNCIIASGINDGDAVWAAVWLADDKCSGSVFRDCQIGAVDGTREDMTRGFRMPGNPQLYGWGSVPQDITIDNCRFGPTITTPFVVRGRDVRNWRILNSQEVLENANLGYLATDHRVWTTTGSPYSVRLDVSEMVYNKYDPENNSRPYAWVCTESGLVHIANTGDTTSGDYYVRNLSSVSSWEAGDPIKGTGIPAATTVTGVDLVGLQAGMDNAATATNTGISLYEGVLQELDAAGDEAPISVGGVTASGNIEVTASGFGLVLKADNGTRYLLEVANDGSLTTSVV